MSKTKIMDVTERDEVIGGFEYHGFRNIMQHDISGIEEEKLPQFTILYKYEKRKNYFIFISTKRDWESGVITDVSSQMLVIRKKEDIKMVARNQFFDASDNVGNVVHIELDTPFDAASIMKQIVVFKK